MVGSHDCVYCNVQRHQCSIRSHTSSANTRLRILSEGSMTPTVKVIGFTKFLGVPSELLPKDINMIAARAQDEGSDCARLIECAGRTCYDSYGVGRNSDDYHQHIKEVGHGSVAEHAVINFYLDNISRGCTHELVRHRQGVAISQRSTRYVDEDESPYILHPLVTKVLDGVVLDSVNDSVNAARSAYRTIVSTVEHALLASGADKFTARKQARGAARGLLGNALCTSMVWSANIRALRNCIEQRANPAADAEIRVLFNRIYEEAIVVCPEYFNDYTKVACADGIGYGLTTKYRKI